jgi:hypothetical protein
VTAGELLTQEQIGLAVVVQPVEVVVTEVAAPG